MNEVLGLFTTIQSFLNQPSETKTQEQSAFCKKWKQIDKLPTDDLKAYYSVEKERVYVRSIKTRHIIRDITDIRDAIDRDKPCP